MFGAIVRFPKVVLGFVVVIGSLADVDLRLAGEFLRLTQIFLRFVDVKAALERKRVGHPALLQSLTRL